MLGEDAELTEPTTYGLCRLSIGSARVVDVEEEVCKRLLLQNFLFDS